MNKPLLKIRKKKKMVIMPEWKKDLQPSPPFLPQLSPQLQKGPSPFLSVKRNAIWMGETQVWLGNVRVQTPLHWGDVERAPLTLELVAVNLAHWSYDLMPGSVINCLKYAYRIDFFFPEFISSYNMWWQWCYGSVVLSLITNSMAISSRCAWCAPAVPEEACSLYSSLAFRVI